MKELIQLKQHLTEDIDSLRICHAEYKVIMETLYEWMIWHKYNWLQTEGR